MENVCILQWLILSLGRQFSLCRAYQVRSTHKNGCLQIMTSLDTQYHVVTAFYCNDIWHDLVDHFNSLRLSGQWTRSWLVQKMSCPVWSEAIICTNAEILLTHWDRVTHICVGKLTIIGSNNGLSPDRRQAIIWTNDGISLIGPLGTNFSEILIKIHTFSFKKMHLKMSSGKRRPFCFGLNVLTTPSLVKKNYLSCLVPSHYLNQW